MNTELELEMILTYEKRPQQTWNGTVPVDQMRDPGTFAAFAETKAKHPAQLVKISACVYYHSETEKRLVPGWFLDCNGKIFHE